MLAAAGFFIAFALQSFFKQGGGLSSRPESLQLLPLPPWLSDSISSSPESSASLSTGWATIFGHPWLSWLTSELWSLSCLFLGSCLPSQVVFFLSLSRAAASDSSSFPTNLPQATSLDEHLPQCFRSTPAESAALPASMLPSISQWALRSCTPQVCRRTTKDCFNALYLVLALLLTPRSSSRSLASWAMLWGLSDCWAWRFLY